MKKQTKNISKPKTTNYKKLLLIISVVIMAIGIISFLLLYHMPYKLEYIVKPSEDKSLQVSLTVRNFDSSKPFQLYKGEVRTTEQQCNDLNGHNVKYTEKDGVIEFYSNSDTINYTYKVTLGEKGKHGARGQIYDDMLTFDGGEVFVVPPVIADGTDEQIKKSIKYVSIKYDVPKEWVVVVPYHKQENGATITYVDSPTWSNFYNIIKSCYAFGKFTKQEYKKNGGLFTLYIDPKCKQNYEEETKRGLNNIFDYYTNLYGYIIPEFSLVLLRNDPTDNSYIMGGSSLSTVGATFDPANKRDWELMSHRICHAYFDTKMTTSKFHQAPFLWFYEGLVTYYENVSLESLSAGLKSKIGIDAQESFLMLFKRYTYMRLKDPQRLAISPMSEEGITSKGAIEFLHYTVAPLIVKTLEDLSYAKYKEHDKLLKLVVANSSNQALGLNDYIGSILGQDLNDFAKMYLFGKGMIPLWNIAEGKTEDPSKVVKELNDIEYTLWTWFRLEDSTYPLDKLDSNKLDELSAQAEKEGVNFATSDVENKIKQMSPTVYKLLKQYALRAKVCGVDYTDLALREKLLGDEELVKKWGEYVGALK